MVAISQSVIVMIRLLFYFFFFNDTATTEIYTLSLHDALPICELGPEDARSLMRACNEPAETALRVNPLRAEVAPTLARLATLDGVLEASGPPPLAPSGALVIEGPLPDAVLAALERGELVAQSRASQAVVEVLHPGPGERVLDLCAGPGIKTSAIAARVGVEGEVVAVEIDPKRASQVRELCARLGSAADSRFLQTRPD